ncbi:MAG: peptidoglycan binding protein CsiV [Acidiferrobacterales bacterium]|nr:peptidoglycan binding protein CsiV [Acidiferrobacterales bacterium]
MKQFKTLSNLLLSYLFASVAFSQAALAQNNDGEEPLLDQRYEDWYQIEILIFDRPRAYSSSSSEAWTNNIALLYPADLDFLFTPEEWETFNAPEPIEENIYDANGNIISATSETESSDLTRNTYQDRSLSTQGDTQKAQYQTSSNDGSTTSGTVSSEFSVTNSPEASIELPAMETPRITLNDTDKILAGERRRIARRSGYRVLFHEAWRQPLIPADESASILITGGDKIESHFELEGSIKLSLSRFLHIETNLWRNFFVPNYGQELAYWPALPDVPEPIKTPNIDLMTVNVSDSDIFSNNTADERFQFNTSYDSQRSESLNLDLNTDLDSKAANNSILGLEQNLQLETANLVNEIFTLRQKRRMRSQELHYIDHPRLGILVKIIPYEVLLPAVAPPLIENNLEDQIGSLN